MPGKGVQDNEGVGCGVVVDDVAICSDGDDWAAIPSETDGEGQLDDGFFLVVSFAVIAQRVAAPLAPYSELIGK